VRFHVEVLRIDLYWRSFGVEMEISLYEEVASETFTENVSQYLWTGLTYVGLE
jgi:hypothetical protein